MRQIVVLSVLLAVSLVGSYLTYTSDQEEVNDEVVLVYNANPADVQRLAWKSKDLTVSIERKKDAAGEYLWVESTETKYPKKKPDPKHPGAVEDDHGHDDEAGPETSPETPIEPEPVEEPTPVVDVAPEVKTSRFMANPQAEDLWKSFAPLKALRKLEVAGGDLDTFGLVEPNATIEVMRGSGPLVLDVGGETYGNKDKYVRFQEKVYLVDDGTLRPLQFAASRLVERSLFPLQESDVERVDVLRKGNTIGFVQQNRDDRAKAYWAGADTLDKKDETVGTWLGKVFKLKLREYLVEADLKDPLETIVAFTIHGAGKAHSIELVKGGESWYARTSYNRSLVSLTETQARDVIDDLDSVLR